MDFEIRISDLRKLLNEIEKEGFNYVSFSDVDSDPDLVDVHGIRRKVLKRQISFEKS